MTGEATRLSIIIPTLDEAAVIRRLLQSLQVLRDAGHELILVDGGSSDDTRRLARPLVDQLLVSPPGRAGQLNTGARAASGDVLWFLHADSRVPRAVMMELPDALLRAASVWGRFDVRLSGRHPMLRLVAFMMNWRSRLTGIATGDQGIFVRRSAFFAVDAFPDIPLMEDIAISRQLRRLARPSCLRQRLVTSGRRWERHGLLKTILLMWRLRLAFACGADPANLARHYRQCSSQTAEY